MNFDPMKVKRGDMFYESEYGITLFGIALENAEINHKENYWQFWALLNNGNKVHVRGQITGGAYNPHLYNIALFPTRHVNFNIDRMKI